MSESDSSREDRQLPATQRRLEQAREEGQLPRSRDILHFVALATLLVATAAFGPGFSDSVRQLLTLGLTFSRSQAIEPANLLHHLASVSTRGLVLIAPIILATSVLLGLSSLIVGGWNISTKALEPKLERVDPAAGFGRLFSPRQLVEHGRHVLLAAVLAGAAWIYVGGNSGLLVALANNPLDVALSGGFGWLQSGIAVLAVVTLVAGAIDAPLQLFRHRAELRMTPDEVRRENRETDGDPQLKGERRRRQRAMSRGRMLSAVPGAQVVVTNPTHYSVALCYDEKTMRAPRIVAVGADHLALKIREVARRSSVPILESAPLARALYQHGDLDGEVPVELYSAVAQVLAWVFQLKAGAVVSGLPVIEIPSGMDPHEVIK